MDDAPPIDEPPPFDLADEPPTVFDYDVGYVVPAPIDFVALPSPIAPLLPPPASPEVLEAIRSLEGSLGKRLDGLQSQFEREARAEATREKIVDRLHAELQDYKHDLLLKTLRPIFVDLIQLHDDIGKMVEVQGESDGEVARLLDLMRGFQQGIEDVLYRQGVEPFSEDGTAFDPRRQRAVTTVPTDDPTLAKTVAARLRKGFQVGGKVIRPEVVSVYAVKL